MGKEIWLVAIFILLLVIPSALALNCTKYKGDYRKLCGIVNPLPLSESYKKSLMKEDLFQTSASDKIDNLYIDLEDQEEITFNQIYEEKISLVLKILLFILFNYALFKFLTKYDKVKKWLPVVY